MRARGRSELFLVICKSGVQSFSRPPATLRTRLYAPSSFNTCTTCVLPRRYEKEATSKRVRKEIATQIVANVIKAQKSTSARARCLTRKYTDVDKVPTNIHHLAKYIPQRTFYQPPNSMDRTQAILAGTEVPTVEDFIEWYEEQASRTGDLGFTTGSYHTKDFFKQWENVNDLKEAFSLENCAQEAMEQMHADVSQLQQRMTIMESFPRLLAFTESEVHRRLLQIGKSDPKFELWVKSQTSLRNKIVRLHKLEHRTKIRAPDGVTAWVYMGVRLERKIIVNLPINASLCEVCRLLEGIGKTEMPFVENFPTGTRSIDADNVWKYHLINKDRSLRNQIPTKLYSDNDYHNMIAQITRQRAPVAVITLVGTRP